MLKNNNKDTKQCTLHGVIVRLGDKVKSKRLKMRGKVTKIGKSGLLLHFNPKNKWDYEWTYWNEISVNAL